MKKLLTLPLLATAAFALNAQTTYTLQEWLFEDPAGTLLEETENTGIVGDASWGDGLTHTTNGEGQYVVGNGDSTLGFQSANLGTRFSGILTYEMEIHSWDLDNNETFRNIAMQYRDAVNGSNVVQFQVNQEGNGNVRFRIEDNNGLGRTVVTEYAELPAVNTATYVISIQLDTETGAWDLSVNGESVFTGTAIVGDMAVIRFIVGNNSFGTGDDTFKVERLSLFSNEEPPPPPGWLGYEIQEDGWVDTGAWLGWLNITHDPWIYSESLGDYMYFPMDQSGEAGAWSYVVN